MMPIVGLVLPIVAALAALRATSLSHASRSRLMTMALAFGGGVGLSSITTLLFITHGVPLTRRFVWIDALLWVAVAAVSWRGLTPQLRDSRPSDQRKSHLATIDWLARIGFIIVAALVIGAQLVEYTRSPHGQWDAWAIWNQKARFLVRGGTEDWKGMLSIPWANPGHPMLVSATVARLWAYAGAEPTFVPGLVAVLFAAAIAVTVIAALDARRPAAWVAGAFVMAPTTFVHQIAAQTADLPLSLFILVALVLLRDYLRAEADTAGTRQSLILAALFAGLAAWTKNEGVVLIAGTSLIVAWTAFRSRRPGDLLWWAAGAALPVATVLWYKLVVAPVPPEYMPATETVASVSGRLLDPSRLTTIGTLAGRFLVEWGGPFARGVLPLTVAAAVAASLSADERPFRYLLVALGIMVAAYAVLWVSAPFDASWLVTTTFDRLMIQLWPTFVVVAFGLTERRAA